MTRIGVLAFLDGTTFQALIDAAVSGQLELEVVVVSAKPVTRALCAGPEMGK
jgi:folate-dependent phosphoribosylglycinamide formyltransferase PurN